jgi:hypothetical protein
VTPEYLASRHSFPWGGARGALARSAPVHHTVHRKVRTYQIAITRYFDLVALHPFF